MSLLVAVPAALGAALAYGGATAVQHNAASSTNRGDARTDTGALLRLVRNPRWLLSIGGDVVGLGLQVLALATGPVILIQPLLVLALPVALPVGWALGGPRPGGRDVGAVVAIVAALAVFFVLVGDPGAGAPASARSMAIASVVAFVAGSAALAAPVRRRTRRAAVLGAVAGAAFGLVGVLINAAALAFERNGWPALMRGAGATALAGVVVVGAGAIVATQLSFQIGELGACFPANESAAPVVAVVMGAVLLHEHIPVGPAYLVGYIVCLVAIALSTAQLALTST